jgi:hypothetical protein
LIVLGIDPAKQSGWAVIDAAEARIIDCGLALHPFERENAVIAARDAGAEAVAMELLLFGPRKTQASLNRSSGRWLEYAETVLGIREADVSFLAPKDWRTALGAPSRWAGTTQPQRRAAAKLWAISFAQSHLGARSTVSDDEAEAACVAYAAALRSGSIRATVPVCTVASRKSGSRRGGSRKSRGASGSSGKSDTKSAPTRKRKPRKRKSTSGMKSTSKT